MITNKQMTVASQKLRNHLEKRIAEYEEKLKTTDGESDFGKALFRQIVEENKHTLNMLNIFEERYELLQHYK